MNASSIRVLVTAVGGTLGQAVVKALRLARPQVEILGCDADAVGVGAAFVDSFHAVPLASDVNAYRARISEICAAQRVAAVIPASESEIEALNADPPLEKVAVICQPREWFATYADKLRCMQALAGKLQLAAFADGSDSRAVERIVAEVGFPLVVKGRRSSGSRHLRCARNEDELRQYLAELPFPLVQQYIDDADGEFSIGLFACPRFTAAVALKRRLAEGCTWYAETSQDEHVLAYARSFAACSKLQGAANLQVRKGKASVRLLEVNPRFSSLAAARALCGFRDVEWSLAQALGQMPSVPPQAYGHIRFNRFFHELVDSGSGYGLVPQWDPRSRH